MISYKLETWQGSSGNWYCNNIKNISGVLGKWYAAMRLSGFSIEEYIDTLRKFNAKNIHYLEDNDFLSFHFATERDAKAFCNYINKAIRLYNK